MSPAQGNNTPTRSRIEPGSPDPESDALTTRPVRSPSPPPAHKRFEYGFQYFYIMPTCPCNVDSLKPHFYIDFSETGVYRDLHYFSYLYTKTQIVGTHSLEPSQQINTSKYENKAHFF